MRRGWHLASDRKAGRHTSSNLAAAIDTDLESALGAWLDAQLLLGCEQPHPLWASQTSFLGMFPVATRVLRRATRWRRCRNWHGLVGVLQQRVIELGGEGIQFNANNVWNLFLMNMKALYIFVLEVNFTVIYYIFIIFSTVHSLVPMKSNVLDNFVSVKSMKWNQENHHIFETSIESLLCIKFRPKCRNRSSDPALDSVPEVDHGCRLSSLVFATAPPPEHERNMLAPSERHFRWPGTKGFFATAPAEVLAVREKIYCTHFHGEPVRSKYLVLTVNLDTERKQTQARPPKQSLRG